MCEKLARFLSIQACAAKHFPGVVKVDQPLVEKKQEKPQTEVAPVAGHKKKK